MTKVTKRANKRYFNLLLSRIGLQYEKAILVFILASVIME